MIRGLHVSVLNPPVPAEPACCESREGCGNPAQKWFYTRWLCNLHFLRSYRDLEMNNDLGDVA